MAQMCKWLSVYLCMRDSPKTDTIHPDVHKFDAVIVWKESPKEKTGGLAYDVILKPANPESAPRPSSPPKERPLSQEDIDRKLKDAEERRQSMELAKLQAIAKDKERAQEANQRIQVLNESFSKVAEKRLSDRMETMAENKNAQIKALQDRLKEHGKRVEEVRQSSDNYVMQLKEKIDNKMENAQGNRQAQLRTIQDRLRDHEKHVEGVIEASMKLKASKSHSEEKIMEKMETTLKNREEQLDRLVQRLQEHEDHIKDVQKNKPAGDGDHEVEAS